MYIANCNNCWFTNVGEAFIDVGVQSLFRKLQQKNSDIKYGTLSIMSHFYLKHIRTECPEKMSKIDFIREELGKRDVCVSDYFYPDLYLFPGIFATLDFLAEGCRSRYFAEQVVEHGGRIAFIGMGANRYSDEERKGVLKIFEKLKPLFVITRDKKTYDLYHDYVDCRRGLDCAFWVNEDFDPTGIPHERYTISTFNRSDEPEDIVSHDEYVRPWHMQYFLTAEKTRYLEKTNLMVSDSPFDYITWYANAEKVYTDLVHATIISLLYGTPVKYYQIDSRKDAFESIPYITEDENGFMRLDHNMLEEEKTSIENYILGKLKEIN